MELKTKSKVKKASMKNYSSDMLNGKVIKMKFNVLKMSSQKITLDSLTVSVIFNHLSVSWSL